MHQPIDQETDDIEAAGGTGDVGHQKKVEAERETFMIEGTAGEVAGTNADSKKVNRHREIRI